MKNKIAFMGIMGAILASAGANAATLATEGFVRGGVANAKAYTDTATANKAELQGAGAVEVATVDANGQYVRSGMTFADLQSAAGDVSGKADLEAAGTAGNVATVDANGQYIRSTVSLGSLADAAAVTTALGNKADTATTYSKTEVDTALDAKQDDLGATAANAGQVLKVDAGGALVWGTDNDSATDISGKADLQTGDTNGNVAVMNGSGQYVDSGVAMGDLAEVTSVNTALATKQDAIVGGADAGKVLVGTATGFEWASTTGDTFVE